MCLNQTQFGVGCMEDHISDASLCASVFAEPARSAGGLVPFKTSDTRLADKADDDGLILIDHRKSRLRRMKSGVMTAARLIFEELQGSKQRYQPWMITPTYRPGEFWKPTHITDLCKCLRSWASRRHFKLRYVWVAEIQERRFQAGALLGECVHYHLLVWIPKRFSLPKPDKQGWWKHGSTQRISVNKPLRYILKYASKGESMDYPKGLRIHGFGGLEPHRKDQRTWWLMPRWVRSLWSSDLQPRRAKGGGFVVRSTGAWYPSIWDVSVGQAVLCRLRNDVDQFFEPYQLRLAINGKA